ncbi:MAG: Disulfide bond formation protein, BdbC-like [Candidatus Woesebacteria bacterium]|nr:MAG: Disulfide bond formation protein, BdbC-like [Candidatus Woesebacteria bacterium]
MTPEVVIKFLALLTLFSNLFIAFLILFLVVFSFLKVRYGQALLSFLRERYLLFSLLVSLVATAGSLFLSEIAHFEPCKLCWFQRIFMYPLPLILGISIYKRIREVTSFVLPFSLIGSIIALYHYYVQTNPQALAPCSIVGFSVSCSERFFTYFGYITIPWMSFSAFFLIFVFMILGGRGLKKR